MLTIARQFAQSVAGLEPLGNGLINDTFLVSTDSQPFVLQKINRLVFSNPKLIMQNLAKLNELAVSPSGEQASLKIPELLKSRKHQYFVIDAHGDYWRAWSYLAGTDCLETLNNREEAEQVGAALGRFHRLCHDFDTAEFHDTLPGFHIAPQYFDHYRQVKAQTRVAENAECKEFIETHCGMIHELENAKSQGLLTLRITHGDPKLNNFLFEKRSGQVISLIDLDTVKPGLIHYDIGDCLRSCCHNHAGDSFNLDICRGLLTSYLNIMDDCLTGHDLDFMYSAIRLIPFELGLRFYTDYLDGDRYFKVTEPGQNLQRAQTQFRLCQSILNQEFAIKRMIKER